jgi:hypothetical protein
MKLLNNLKNKLIWIVFAAISFISTIYLTGEFIDVQHGNNISVKHTTTISTDKNNDEADYESNDHQIIETIGAVLVKFLRS